MPNIDTSIDVPLREISGKERSIGMRPLKIKMLGVKRPLSTPRSHSGHVSLRIASDGEEALITGDFMHHPCQIARPQWSSTADSDPDLARTTREMMLTRLAGAPVLVIGTHFAGRTVGHIVGDGLSFRFAPLERAQRCL